MPVQEQQLGNQHQNSLGLRKLIQTNPPSSPPIPLPCHASSMLRIHIHSHKCLHTHILNAKPPSSRKVCHSADASPETIWCRDRRGVVHFSPLLLLFRFSFSQPQAGTLEVICKLDVGSVHATSISHLVRLMGANTTIGTRLLVTPPLL